MHQTRTSLFRYFPTALASATSASPSFISRSLNRWRPFVSAFVAGLFILVVLAAEASAALPLITTTSATYPSNDCDGLPGNVVIDGFVRSTYYKLRTGQVQGNDIVWICWAMDDGTAHSGGKFVVTGSTGSGVSTGDDPVWCDTSAQIFKENGAVGPIPFSIAAAEYPAGDVFVCATANNNTITKYIHISPSSVPHISFSPDAAIPYPYAAPGGTGSPSAGCAVTGGGGTSLINADVGTARVWLWTQPVSATRTDVCVRVQSPTAAAGGVLTVDSAGSPTLVTYDGASDFTPCDTNILSLSVPQISVRAHIGSPGSWLCVSADTTYRRVKIDSTGGVGVATFRPDQ